MCVRRQLLPREMRLNDEGERTTCPIHREGPQNLNFEIPLWQNLSLQLLRREGDFWILGAFQDVLVHFVITRMAAAIAARRVNHYKSAGMPRGSIKFYSSTFQFERPVNGVEDVAQSKTHLGLIGIKFQYRFLHGCRRCDRDGKQRERQGQEISPQRVELGHRHGGP